MNIIYCRIIEVLLLSDPVFRWLLFWKTVLHLAWRILKFVLCLLFLPCMGVQWPMPLATTQTQGREKRRQAKHCFLSWEPEALTGSSLTLDESFHVCTGQSWKGRRTPVTRLRVSSKHLAAVHRLARPHDCIHLYGGRLDELAQFTNAV